MVGSRHEVAIIGYGPVGAALAILLAQCGVNVLVLDREADIYNLPRAVHYDDEVMRIFQATGIADALLEKVRVNPGMRFVDPDSKLLLDWPRPPGVSSQGWNTSYRFHQPDLERLLRQRAAQLPNVTIKTAHKVSSIETAEDQVILQAEHQGGGTAHFVSDYVVGCDGARSFVRRAIGSDMEDFGFRENWLVVDARLKRPRPDLGDHSIQHCDPAASATYVRCPGDRRRWEFSLAGGLSGTDFDNPAAIWSLLQRWITPEDAELERHAIYEFRSAVARKWSAGRLMIAGDAAHLMPPFMGQGMCAGIRDASNLAWKLAACIRDGAPSKLLDTYQSERRPHAVQYVELSMRLGGLINTSKTKQALEAAFPQADGSAKLESIAPPLGNGLWATGAARQLSHQLKLKCGQRMDDLAGTGPMLLSHSDIAVPESYLGRRLASDQEPAVDSYLQQHNCVAMLVRPDRYIYGVAADARELETLLQGWNTAVTNKHIL